MDFWPFLVVGTAVGIFVWMSSKPITTKRKLGVPPWKDVPPPKRKWE